MFGKKPAKAATPLEKSDIKAFLGPGSQFEGNMAFTEIVRLDGLFRGEIHSQDTLIVGQSGELQAEIKVGTLILSGKLKGNVTADIRVELRAPAEVEGNIATPVLTVEEGVVFNGSLQMRQPAPQSPAKGGGNGARKSGD
ncbi:bactofilin family protein [Geoalkalibacter sp.]|uniref:bactofilin family protein n=1 Tax=Geoalkalibacter sp. TaxID=3041440 RepID=UPI00272E5661|nr:polymer-forming cytoskeletal protein [Geoalkalibacter sp.]